MGFVGFRRVFEDDILDAEFAIRIGKQSLFWSLGLLIPFTSFECHTQPEGLQPALRIQEMLLREDLCRSHEGGLLTRLHGLKHGRQSDDRFPAADIAVEKSVHRLRSAHVVLNLAQTALLRAGKLKG